MLRKKITQKIKLDKYLTDNYSTDNSKQESLYEDIF